MKARGAAAVNAVAALLNDPNPYMRGRAIFLLYQLGPEGQQARGRAGVAAPIRRCASRPTAPCGAPDSTSCRWRPRSPATRMPASGAKWRCRCATSPRPTSLDILVDIARGFDGQDRSYLEALGTGATGKEPALYDRLRRELGVKDDPLAVVRRPSRGSRGGCTCPRRCRT